MYVLARLGTPGRKMMNLAVLAGMWFNATFAREGDFILSVNTLAAFDGGPHVVQLRLTYLGEQEVVARLYGMRHANMRRESLSPQFLMPFYRSLISDSSNPVEDVLFSKGMSITEHYYLHQISQKYPSAGVPFVAESRVKYWQTKRGKPYGDPISATLRKKVLLTRTKPTSEQLARVQTDLLSRLRASYSGEAWEECREWLRNTRYGEFCPVAVRMLDATQDSDLQCFSFEYLIECSGDIDEAKGLLISVLMESELASANIFVAWKQSGLKLPTRVEVQSLLGAPNMWVRGLCVAAVPELVPRERRDAVFAEFRKYQDPEPSREFCALVAKLDAQSFQEREHAVKRLVSMGERVEGMVARSLANPPSAEVEIRLKRVLTERRMRDPVPESFRTIRALGRMNTLEAKEFLKVIADGPPGLRSTQEAKKAIAGRKEVPVPVERKPDSKDKK